MHELILFSRRPLIHRELGTTPFLRLTKDAKLERTAGIKKQKSPLLQSVEFFKFHLRIRKILNGDQPSRGLDYTDEKVIDLYPAPRRSAFSSCIFQAHEGLVELDWDLNFWPC